VPIILQPMLRGTVELIAGASRQQGLGLFLIAGLGGVYTEALDEVTLIPAEVDVAVIRARIDASRLGRLLAAVARDGEAIGRPDPRDGLIKTLAAIQELVVAASDVIDSIDVNPLLVTETGTVAVDALLVVGDGS